jgi:recombinational DNA repair protein RecT
MTDNLDNLELFSEDLSKKKEKPEAQIEPKQTLQPKENPVAEAVLLTPAEEEKLKQTNFYKILKAESKFYEDLLGVAANYFYYDLKRMYLKIVDLEAKSYKKEVSIAVSDDKKRQFFNEAIEFKRQGLSLNMADKHVYVTDYPIRGFLMITPQGLVHLLGKQGIQVNCQEVYESDEFDIDLANMLLSHKVKSLGRSRRIGLYCIFWRIQGDHYKTKENLGVELFREEDIDFFIKKFGKEKGTWADYTGEMLKKTVIRRGIKRLNLSDPSLNRIFENEDSDSEIGFADSQKIEGAKNISITSKIANIGSNQEVLGDDAEHSKNERN